MALNLNRFLKQKALYWEKLGRDGSGKTTFSPLVEVDVRWEYMMTEFVDITGEKRLSNSTILINQDIVLGSWVYLGTYASWLTALGIDVVPGDSSGLDFAIAGTGDVQAVTLDSPSLGNLARELRAVEKFSDIKAKVYVRKGYMV